jgi:hypothetical protein
LERFAGRAIERPSSCARLVEMEQLLQSQPNKKPRSPSAERNAETRFPS